MSQNLHGTRRPDLTDGDIAIYRVTPEGKKPFYEIYDGPQEARIRIRMFPDILNVQFDEYTALQLYKGESRLIRGKKNNSNVTYPAYICLRRTKSKIFTKDGVASEDHTAELGIAYPKFGTIGKAPKAKKEEIGYRLWTGPGEPLVDFILSGKVRPTAKDCFTLIDGGIVSINNVRLKLRKLEETQFEGKPIRIARLTETTIKRKKGTDAPAEAETTDESEAESI